MLKIGRIDYERMIAQLRASLPLEACGLMAGLAGRVTHVYPIDNRLSSPHAFEMDPKQQVEAILDLEKRGWKLVAIYHSHPKGPETPSLTDISKANYPDTLQIVVSFRIPQRPVIRSFTIVGGQVTEIRFQVV
jgi:proteasome lid subunit RPN8/RPN11